MNRESIKHRLNSYQDLVERSELFNDRQIAPIRVHHLATYCFISQGWQGWLDSSSKKPWELDSASRTQIANKVAYTQASNSVVDKLVQRTLQSEGKKSPLYSEPEYIDDLIGKDDESAKKHQEAIYLLYRLFFISLDHEEKQFPLTMKVDDICRSCIGDGSGVGVHCNKNVKPKENRDFIVTKRLSFFEGRFVTEVGGQLYVSADAFFDKLFFDKVSFSK